MRCVGAPAFAYYFLGRLILQGFGFYGVAVNGERSNELVTEPHKKKGNRISPSGEKSKLNWTL